MERLTDVAELLDGPLDDRQALAGNLLDLRRINRLLGGVRLSRLAIDRLIDGADEVSMLDVGTGGADIPVALLADARRRRRRMRIVGIDVRAEVIAAARAVRPVIGRLADLSLDVSDGRALPHPDRSFDVVHASLVIHHFEPDEAVALLREMTRVARLGVVVNDLARGPINLAWSRLMVAVLTRNRYTRKDAPLSVRRAYTLDEMRELLARAGLRPIAELGVFGGHRYAVAAVRA
jgi:ubiquinone/menaquinone biosynthesis C-methylase UbiE